jgi:hypothetical protein
VTNEYKFAPTVVLENLSDFVDKNILIKSLVGYARTNGHNFDCDYSNRCVISAECSSFVNVPKKIGVRIQTYANTMDKQYR